MIAKEGLFLFHGGYIALRAGYDRKRLVEVGIARIPLQPSIQYGLSLVHPVQTKVGRRRQEIAAGLIGIYLDGLLRGGQALFKLAQDESVVHR